MPILLLIAWQMIAVKMPAEELAARFPPAWRLPRVDRAGKDLPSARFEESLSRLIEDPIRAADAAAGRPALTFGDLLARSLEAAEAVVPAAQWPQVRALLDRQDALSPKWDPDDADARAGFLFGPSWDLPADCWPAHDGSRTVEQCAVFIAADLASIRACEFDFSLYAEHPGSRYLSVAPVADSYFFSEQPAATDLAVDFQCDLPFPFSSYSYRLHYFTALDERERPRTFVHSDSPDFHWLAGCDLYLSVHDGAGNFAGTLIIRQAGADLDGVPDRSSHHQAGMRSSLGGLRRDAERHFRLREDRRAFPSQGAVPVCPVLAPAR